MGGLPVPGSGAVGLPRGGPGSTWTLDHVTSDRPDLPWQNVLADTVAALTITRSVFTGGQKLVVIAGGTYKDNCVYGIMYQIVGPSDDPMYPSAQTYGSMSVDASYTVAAPACASFGTSVTSGSLLLKL